MKTTEYPLYFLITLKKQLKKKEYKITNRSNFEKRAKQIIEKSLKKDDKIFSTSELDYLMRWKVTILKMIHKFPKFVETFINKTDWYALDTNKFFKEYKKVEKKGLNEEWEEENENTSKNENVKELFIIEDKDKFLKEVRKIVKEELLENKNKNIPEKKSPFIKLKEVSELLYVSKPTIYEWIKKNYIQKYKINSRTYFNKDEILEFFEAQK